MNNQNKKFRIKVNNSIEVKKESKVIIKCKVVRKSITKLKKKLHMKNS